jgi:ubiquinone/menaquinone biosynthesis C-methylase UbiE
MLLIENMQFSRKVESHNILYGENEEVFTHKIPKAVIELLFHYKIEPNNIHSALDIGCGQGQLLYYLYNEVVKANRNVDASKFVGVDISDVAIKQADIKYPMLGWAIDSIQNLIVSNDLKNHLEQGVDIVINRGGFLDVSDEVEYETTLRNLYKIMSKDSYYLFIQSKKFYKKWKHGGRQDWNLNIFDIMHQVFDDLEIFEDSAYNIVLYKKQSSGKKFRDSTVFSFLSGLEHNKESFNLNVEQDLLPYFSDLLDEELSETAFCIPSARQFANNKKRIVNRVNSLKSNVEHNKIGKRIVLYDGVLLNRTNYIKISADKMFLKKLARIGNPIFYPRILKTSRHISDSLYTIISANPDVVLLGWGISDYKINEKSGEVFVPVDEFKARMEWCFRLLRSIKCRVIFIDDMNSVLNDTNLNSIDSVKNNISKYKEALEDISMKNNVDIFVLQDNTNSSNIFKRNINKKDICNKLFELVNKVSSEHT